MSKTRLWRVDILHTSGYHAPSLYVETATAESKTRETAEQEAIKMAKEKSGLGRFQDTWLFIPVHLDNYFLLREINSERWVRQGVYELSDSGRWRKKK